MSKPRYYYPDKEQQRQASSRMVLLAIVFVLIMTAVFACIGFDNAMTKLDQVDLTDSAHDAVIQWLFFQVIERACIGFILAILVILAIVLWRRFAN